MAEQLACQTEFGPIRAGWNKVRMVEFLGGTNQCRLRLANGDHIQVRFDAGPFILDTLFGKLTLPNHALVKIEVFDPRQMPDGLVLHYNFENIEADEVPDLSGHGHHGKLLAAARISLQGKSKALELDGRRGAVSVGNPPKLRLQNFSIACWARRSDPKLATHDPNGGGHLAGCGSGGFCFVLLNDGRVCLAQVDGDISKRAFPEFRVTDDDWHHLAVTKQGRMVVFYLDGAPHQSNGLDATFAANATLAVGACENDRRGGVFLGSLDEVMIFDRCLTAEDIKRIFERTK